METTRLVTRSVSLCSHSFFHQSEIRRSIYHPLSLYVCSLILYNYVRGCLWRRFTVPSGLLLQYLKGPHGPCHTVFHSERLLTLTESMPSTPDVSPYSSRLTPPYRSTQHLVLSSALTPVSSLPFPDRSFPLISDRHCLEGDTLIVYSPSLTEGFFVPFPLSHLEGFPVVVF